MSKRRSKAMRKSIAWLVAACATFFAVVPAALADTEHFSGLVFELAGSTCEVIGGGDTFAVLDCHLLFDYTGGMVSTEGQPAVISGIVTIDFVTGDVTGEGTQVFYGCVYDACGTMFSSWATSGGIDPETGAPTSLDNVFTISGGTGAFCGAVGSYDLGGRIGDPPGWPEVSEYSGKIKLENPKHCEDL